MTKKKRIRTTNPNNFKPSKRGWTTDPQEEFLLTHLPAYRTCQATKKFDKFWIEVERNFAKQWPVPPPTEMEGENRVTQKDKNAERKKVGTLCCSVKSMNTYILQLSHRISTPGLITSLETESKKLMLACYSSSCRRREIKLSITSKHTQDFTTMTVSRPWQMNVGKK